MQNIPEDISYQRVKGECCSGVTGDKKSQDLPAEPERSEELKIEYIAGCGIDEAKEIGDQHKREEDKVLDGVENLFGESVFHDFYLVTVFEVVESVIEEQEHNSLSEVLAVFFDKVFVAQEDLEERFLFHLLLLG